MAAPPLISLIRTFANVYVRRINNYIYDKMDSINNLYSSGIQNPFDRKEYKTENQSMVSKCVFECVSIICSVCNLLSFDFYIEISFASSTYLKRILPYNLLIMHKPQPTADPHLDITLKHFDL